MLARQVVVGLRHAPKFLSSRSISSNAPKNPAQSQSWLTRKVKSSPSAMNAFLGITNLLGYGSPKQVAGRRTFAMYEQVIAVTPDADTQYWQKDCHLPPTFQSWFTVTNLHIWMLTVRLRSLKEGKHYTQGLVDHFFIDIEDRIRAVLQPAPPSRPIKPYTFASPFYINPNLPSSSSRLPKPLARAPDRLVTRQMKIFKEQWAGMGLALDLGLVKGDMDMAAAVWRNLLGARGAQGIAFPDPSSPSSSSPKFRRSVNLVGGEVVNVAKVDFAAEEARDDGSGVHDFLPSEADLYLAYPQLMLDITGYIRRELVRLERLSDHDIENGPLHKLKFGRVRE